MSLVDLWPWLESLPIAAAIGESWWFPLLESIHVLTATFLVGSILMVDLRLLGLAATSYSVSRVVRETVPWTYSASVISVITGIGLFIPRASHYVDNRAFQIKLVLLVLAGLNMAVFHLATSRGMAHRDAAVATTTTGARFAGASSLLLWVGVLLAGRWIGHLN
jgi:hypothetical protein